MKKLLSSVLAVVFFLMIMTTVRAAEIFDAVLNDDVRAARALLDKNPALAREKDNNGETPLHVAVCHSNKSMAELLLAKGADVNAVDMGGKTPLIDASISGGNRDLALLLITKRAKVNELDKAGHTPLYHALKATHESMAELLRNYGGE